MEDGWGASEMAEAADEWKNEEGWEEEGVEGGLAEVTVAAEVEMAGAGEVRGRNAARLAAAAVLEGAPLAAGSVAGLPFCVGGGPAPDAAGGVVSIDPLRRRGSMKRRRLCMEEQAT